MVSLPFRYARLKLRQLTPHTPLGRFALYVLVVDLFLYVLKNALRLAGATRASEALSAWTALFTALLAVLGSILGFRWMRERLMWRLRNRLIVTYMFIGVIPVLLIGTMALGAAFLFGGQFATYLATSDIQSELKALSAANATLAAELAHSLQSGESGKALPALEEQRMSRRWAGRQVTLWHGGKARLVEGEAGSTPLGRPAWFTGEEFRGVAYDKTGVYLRVINTMPLRGEKLTVVSSVPLNKELLESITGNFAEITVTDLGSARNVRQAENEAGLSASQGPLQPPGEEKGLVIDDEARPDGSGPVPTINAGAVPPARIRLDTEFRFMALFPMLDWANGATTTEGLIVRTRPSALYTRLFRTLGELTTVIVGALIGTAVVFGVIELIALFIGIGLTRTITRSVHELYRATQRINRGDLKHRIQVRSNDQLAELERSFNSMAESLERLIAEQREKQRLENELAIAQEVQSQLFPKEISELERLEVFGFCRPARTVSGDYYDFLPFGPEKLGIAVGDVSGKGISAALLMATIHSAVRAYEYGRIPAMRASLVAAGRGDGPTHLLTMNSGAPPGDFSPAGVLALLNRQLYHTTPTEKYATLFLGMYDGERQRLTYSNAGHLPPIILGADDSVRKLDTPGLVIGLFDQQAYEDHGAEMRPGDIFIAFSDGITEPENEYGEFGEARLLEIIRDHRHLPLARIAELVTEAVMDWIGGGEQPDDITLVLARPR